MRGVAEREGFEPSVELPRLRFSRPSDSAALAPLRAGADKDVQLNVVHCNFQMKSCAWAETFLPPIAMPARRVKGDSIL